MKYDIAAALKDCVHGGWKKRRMKRRSIGCVALAVVFIATACGARLTTAQRDAALGGLVNNNAAGPSLGPQTSTSTGPPRPVRNRENARRMTLGTSAGVTMGSADLVMPRICVTAW